MPLLKTLYEPITKNERFNEGVGMPVEKLVMILSSKVVADNPEYILSAYSDEKGREKLKKKIIEVLDGEKYYFSGGRQEFIDRVFDFMFGYGALQKLIDDEDITDIDGTAYNEFSITKNGIRQPVDIDFGDSETFDTYCRLVAIRSGGFLNEDDTHCRTADLKKKLRINVSIPPRNVSGPAISIRKHRNKAYTLSDLEQLGMLDAESRGLLEKFAATENSVLFCGKGAAGKTTLLRAFLNILPELERVLVVESDAEIYPDKPFTIEQRTKKPGEGGSSVNLEMLVKDGLTMSLDTYCIGEITGNEAYSFIKASCTGHRVLGTIHSPSAEEALGRLISLAAGAMEGDSVERVTASAAAGLDIIVYLRDFRVLSILGVREIRNAEITYKAIYRRDEE